MGRTIVVMLFLALVSASAEAQQSFYRDYWLNAAECTTVPAATTPFYHPSILRKQVLGPNEIIRGHPTGGCFEMVLPDRLGGRGHVRIEAGRQFVYNRLTGQVLRLSECNNVVFSWVPFPSLTGRDGRDGTDGKDGLNGIGINGRDGINGRNASFSWKPLAVTGGVLAGLGGAWALVKWLNDSRHHDKPAEVPKGPGVTSDSSKVICTGLPCVGGPPGVSPLRSGNGLMLSPASRSIGWRFALPRR